MTTKLSSQAGAGAGRMGRNPFATKPVVTVRPTSSANAQTGTRQAGKAATHAFEDGFLFRALALPVKGIVFSLKSLLVVRYLIVHPGEWRV